MAPSDLMCTPARRQDEWRQAKTNVPDLVLRYAGEAVTTYRVISDHLGSPMMAVNVNNASDVPFAAEYSAFGERTVTSDVMSEDWLPFGFAGGLYDADTGLVRFGARDYDAVIGRWTAKDSTRWGGGQGNLYLYVGGDCINGLDPSGAVAVPAAVICAIFAAMAAATAAVVTIANSKGGQDAIEDALEWLTSSEDVSEVEKVDDCRFVRDVYWPPSPTKTCIYKCRNWGALVQIPQHKDLPCPPVGANGLVDTSHVVLP